MDARKQSFPKTLTPAPVPTPRQGGYEAWLLGQPALQDYIDHVRKNVVGGGEIAKSALVNEWRAANDHYYDLEASEAGLPDTIGIRELGPDLLPLADALKASVPFKNSFDDVPSRVAFVELDKLIVAQPNIDLDHIDRLIATLGSAPDPKTLFQFCLPLDKPSPAVKMRRAGSKRFLFWSDCHDFRFHEASVLSPTQIADYESFGPLAAILGLGVGFVPAP